MMLGMSRKDGIALIQQCMTSSTKAVEGSFTNRNCQLFLIFLVVLGDCAAQLSCALKIRPQDILVDSQWDIYGEFCIIYGEAL